MHKFPSSINSFLDILQLHRKGWHVYFLQPWQVRQAPISRNVGKCATSTEDRHACRKLRSCLRMTIYSSITYSNCIIDVHPSTEANSHKNIHSFRSEKAASTCYQRIPSSYYFQIKTLGIYRMPSPWCHETTVPSRHQHRYSWSSSCFSDRKEVLKHTKHHSFNIKWPLVTEALSWTT